MSAVSSGVLRCGKHDVTAQNQSVVKILPPADVLNTTAASDRVTTVILDPWYNKGIGGEREDYNDWLAEIIQAACRVSVHYLCGDSRKYLLTKLQISQRTMSWYLG